MKISSISLLLISCLIMLPTFNFAQENGKASYYNDNLHGNKTASGEPYDKTKFTAAHRTLPFGAIVRVTNQKNKKAVIVRINDMGPHNLSRIIDLSGAAADAIDMKIDGVVEVSMDVIAEYPDENTSKIKMGPTSGGSVPTTASSSSASTSNNARRGQSALKVVYGSNQRTASTPATTSSLSLPNIKSGQAPSGLNQAPAQVNATGQVSQAGANQRVMRSSTSTPVDTKGSGLFKFVAYKTPADGYGIQLGVYADYRTVLEQANQLAQSNIQDIMIHATNDGQKDLFRMIVGPFSNRGSAENFKQQLTSIGKQGFIVVLQDLN